VKRRPLTPEQRSTMARVAYENGRHAAEKRPLVWPPERVQLLRQTYTEKGYSAALNLFPDVSAGASRAAIRRYCSGPETAPLSRSEAQRRRAEPSCWRNPEFSERWMAVLVSGQPATIKRARGRRVEMVHL
jgi:hypothetical protein